MGLEKVWSGTATDLLKELSLYVDDAIKRTKAWPGVPQLLSRRMRWTSISICASCRTS